jgi:hypothetical protein
MALAAPKHKDVKVPERRTLRSSSTFAPFLDGQLARFCSDARRAEAALTRYRIRASKRVSSAPLLDTTRAPWRVTFDAFATMHGLNPLQDLLYFVRDPWPWGKPHEAAGIHRTSRQHCNWMPRTARAADDERLQDRTIHPGESTNRH